MLASASVSGAPGGLGEGAENKQRNKTRKLNIAPKSSILVMSCSWIDPGGSKVSLWQTSGLINHFFPRADWKEGIIIPLFQGEKENEAQLGKQKQPSTTLPHASEKGTAERM